jgi:hypothetical protein
MEDYKYDVFISYKRGDVREQWLDQIFLPLFTSFLSGLMPAHPRIFVDREDLKPGIPWKPQVTEALARSKCMIAILSPAYFSSRWCMMEFYPMYYRQVALQKAQIIPSSQSLIAPLVGQGPKEFFPQFVSGENGIQLLDYSRYNRVGTGFMNSDLFLELQDKIDADSLQTYKMIQTAPAWTERFTSKEWLDGPFDFPGGNPTSQNPEPKQSATLWV